jgi:hypothetical protein
MDTRIDVSKLNKLLLNVKSLDIFGPKLRGSKVGVSVLNVSTY